MGNVTRKNQLWTDEELALIADPPPGMSAADIGAILGRSESAVWNITSRIRKGWSPQRNPWSETELDYIRSHPNLTAEQVGEALGRSPGAVAAKRRALAAEGLSFWVNKSPHNAGRRRVLAKTCVGCGLLLDGRFFADRGFFTTRCGPCRRQRLDHVGDAEASRAAMARREAVAKEMAPASMPYKSRHYAEVTDWDHEVLSAADLTSVQKAVILGRSVKAVESSMSKFGYTENRSLGNPEDGVWHISFAAPVEGTVA